MEKIIIFIKPDFNSGAKKYGICKACEKLVFQCIFCINV